MLEALGVEAAEVEALGVYEVLEARLDLRQDQDLVLRQDEEIKFLNNLKKL